MKQKAVILSNIVWTIANFRRYLITDLIQKGFEVYCIADTDTFSERSIHQIEATGATFIRLKTNRKGINPLTEMVYLYRLYRILKRVSPDIILSYTIKPNIFGSLCAGCLSIPQIATVNGLGSGIMGHSWLARFSLFLYKVTLRFPQKILFQNREDLDFFVASNIVDPSKTLYVPGSGIDVSEFSDCSRSISSSHHQTVFLMVARLIADKGVYEYIEAAKRLKETFPRQCEFLLAGHFDTGNPTAVTQQKIREWERTGIIRYLGTTDTIRDFFVQADVVVLPSYREGLSRLLLEAASCEKPLIVSDVPGCRELVHEGENGFVCSPKNADSLVEAMKRMLMLPESTRHAFGSAGKAIVEQHFGKDRVNALYLQTIEEILV